MDQSRTRPFSPWERVSFDACRALAAQLVVIGHAISFWKVLLFVQPPSFAYLQNVGVILFFFLSGLLITSSIIDNSERDQSYDFRHFLFDRATRIFSALIPSLLFVAVIDVALIQVMPEYKYRNSLNVPTFVGNFLFLQDYPVWTLHGWTFTLSPLHVSSFGSARPLWTLAVEWWLYIAAGAMLVRWPTHFFGRLGVLVLLALSVPVVFLNYIEGRGDGLVIVWILGVLSAGSFRSRMFGRVSAPTWLVAAVLSASWAMFGIDDMVQGAKGYELHASVMLVLALYCVLKFFGTLKGSPPKSLARAAEVMAGYSYTLYLVHYTVLYGLVGVFHAGGGIIGCIGGILLANIVSFALASGTEMRLARIKNRLWAGRSVTPPDGGTLSST